jgi:uncharacterized membrane protein (DUF4010 family)
MTASQIFELLGISLGLGVLVGLQRERTESELAGVRTFPLITILGTVSALIADVYGGWILGIGILAITALVVMGNLAKLKGGSIDAGMTSEMAMLLMYGVGAYLVIGHRGVAIAVGGGVAVLLHAKDWMHAIARKIGDKDFTAVMQFVLITLVVLPVLPNRTYGPYDVLNPREIWLMVVLIVGISLGGYSAYKTFGSRVGTLVGGFLGGLISSTATTVSYARRARTSPGLAGLAAVVVMIASAVVFVRVLIEIAVVDPSMLREAGPPILIMLGVISLAAAYLWRISSRQQGELPRHDNPTNLKSAFIFGILYAIVIFAVAAAKEHFGTGGLYVVSAISGLTDMDAITLSNTQLTRAGRLTADTAWRLILVASLSNLAFKAGMVALLGSPRLLRHILAGYSVAFVVGVALVAFW